MIRFNHVTKTWPDSTTAVNDLTLEVARGETLVLLGTSGSGKTTTMKMVNRLIDPTSGEIKIDGVDIMEQDAIELRRRIGYAIQQIGLFPHMTVRENISVVPKMLNWTKEAINERVEMLLTMVSMEPDEFSERYPAQLSGGQRQRIGVARALAADPPIVLMDEPFGALDPITREQLQNEFLDLQSEIQKTIIFVTHDVFEAVKMGDRIALLDQGELQQLATPAELVDSPANEFVDSFLGRHRFQLSLLTSTLGRLVDRLDTSQPEPERVKWRLTFRHSLIDALDEFKNLKVNQLPVYKRKEYQGILRKDALLSVISHALGSTGDAEK